MRLQPGEWLIRYIHTTVLKMRTDGGDQLLQLQPSDMFVLQETEALQFLAMIQRRHPECLDYFEVLSR